MNRLAVVTANTVRQLLPETLNRGLLLNPGDQFPSMKLSLLKGSELSLPEEIAGSWAYIAFYRGQW